MRKMILAMAMAVAIPGLAVDAAADDVKLPPNLSWTAYGTTSSGYAQSIGLGNMLKAKYGTELRVIPGKNDVSRMLPLKVGQVNVCACGIASYFSREGVLMFAGESWGPQRIRNLFNNIGRNGTVSMALPGDGSIQRIQDLKGKRITWVRGAPALNVNTEAALAYGGLTWDDVVKVEMPGFGQSMQAIIDGQADSAVGSTITGIYAQIAASPRGLFHPTFPHNDAEAWARVHAVAPYMSKQMISNAINGESNPTGKLPYEGMSYPYPIFVGMPDLSDDTAYGLTKAVMENYEHFKEAGPGMDGYQLQNQDFVWVYAYHPGAIRYYKEAGVWTAEAQANTDLQLRREEILQKAWSDTLAGGHDEQRWLTARAAALDAAGMDVPFRN